MTSQEEPVVVRLDAARRRASDVLVGWRTETCDPPDRFMRIGEQLVDFPVKAKRFGDVFEYTVDGDAGSRFTLAYDLAGKLTSRGARGSAPRADHRTRRRGGHDGHLRHGRRDVEGGDQRQGRPAPQGEPDQAGHPRRRRGALPAGSVVSPGPVVRTRLAAVDTTNPGGQDRGQPT